MELQARRRGPLQVDLVPGESQGILLHRDRFFFPFQIFSVRLQYSLKLDKNFAFSGKRVYRDQLGIEISGLPPLYDAGESRFNEQEQLLVQEALDAASGHEGQ